KIIIPTLSQLQKEKIPYSGFLFIGLMKVGDEPYVIEYNVRMGDPETEVVLPRIESDFVELLSSVAPKKLDEIKLKIKSEFAVCVMLASGGYPEKYKTNYPIEIGADIAAETYLFHAGSFVDELGTMRTNAGRVIAVTTLDPDLRTAIKKTYTQVDKVKFKDRYFRGDIGKDLLCI
ncbi:MAG: phosphoribosylglycinamide synthetase C domain-containing protein, partial [Bacteroidales bacterium]